MSTTLTPEAPLAAQEAAPAKPYRRAAWLGMPLALLCLGHFTVDMYSASVSTLQPLLVERYGLSLAQSGILGGAFLLGSAVTQLLFGLVSDSIQSKWFAVIGVLVAGIGLSSLALAPDFQTLLVITLAGGLGVAAFHPQSTAQAGQLGGVRRGFVVALFISAGTLGLSFGPAYFSMLTTRLGIDWLWMAALPALVIAGILSFTLPKPTNAPPARRRIVDWEAFREHWKSLLIHYLVVLLRSAVQLGFGQFLTLYLYNQRQMSLGGASLVLGAFFASVAVGSVLGGGLADRFGQRRVVVCSLLVSVPFLVGFMLTTGWVSALLLFTGGLFLLMSNPVIVVMAQELMPSQASTVTAIMMGFGWGMAGITFVPALGWLADRIGLESVLWGVAFFPIVTFLVALKLPDRRASAVT